MSPSTGQSEIAGFSPPVLGIALIGLGHVGALLVLPREPATTTVLALEGVLLLSLLVLSVVRNGVGRELVLLSGAFVLATAGTWVLLISGTSLWWRAIAVVTVLSLVGYGLHRYELVSLGLVEVDDE
ncbi:hypothetical protein VB773_02265 [Haloarculaceae archaeon H-GB2-1]|nr:hypothetical protein [Haloarculaceae archaeon H-GB1-1]MEA5388484.1 hypothetical protein [Haloarculaceae archaeon H-GB11]MEA5406519.1 hypothetical protein [Haloarculaceae archaeon H-GB2-1]